MVSFIVVRGPNNRRTSSTAAQNVATQSLLQLTGEIRGKPLLPVADGFMGQFHAAEETEFDDVAQAQGIPQAPEHHQQHQVGREFQEVEGGCRPFIVGATARPAPKPMLAKLGWRLQSGDPTGLVLRTAHGMMSRVSHEAISIPGLAWHGNPDIGLTTQL